MHIDSVLGTTANEGMVSFPQGAILMLEIIIFLIVILVVLYVGIWLLRMRRLRRFSARGKNKCAICGHKVEFISECCKVEVKYMGPSAVCSKCRKICEVVCEGCGNSACESNCERCVRKVWPDDKKPGRDTSTTMENGAKDGSQ